MPPPRIPTRLAVGVMSGTSLDGLDAALVRLDGRGLDMAARLVRLVSMPLGDLAAPLRAAAEQRPMAAGDLARLAWDFGLLHVEVIEELLEGAMPGLIAVHGQTVFHQPPVSWQLINPAPIEHRFRCPVLADLRQSDLAAGGQGAPITPLADWVMFRSPAAARAIVNLGGFCNITFLPASSTTRASPPPSLLAAIHGLDVCPCNQLLDAVARCAWGIQYDEGGHHASAGTARDDLVSSLHLGFQRLREEHRSLGTGDEAPDWVRDHLDRASAHDLAASACAAIGRGIADAIEAFEDGRFTIDEIILAGGGTRHAALVAAIHTRAHRPVSLSDQHGIPVEAREAMAMAVLGALRIDGVPVTLPQVTRRTEEHESPTTSSVAAVHRAADQPVG